MGVDVARAYPAAMACFRRGEDAAGLRLARAVRARPARAAHRDALRAARDLRRQRRARARGRRRARAGRRARDTRSASTARSRSPARSTFETALTLVNERGLAMHRAAIAGDGAMAAVLGLAPDALRAARRASGRARRRTRGAGELQRARPDRDQRRRRRGAPSPASSRWKPARSASCRSTSAARGTAC